MENKIKRQRIKSSIEELTQGEKLVLWRRRKNWDQVKAAKYYKVSYFRYKLCEYDRASIDVSHIDLGSLQDHEKCLIYRKRSGKIQTQIAKEFGIGREWLRMQEQGTVPCSKLLTWWEK